MLRAFFFIILFLGIAATEVRAAQEAVPLPDNAQWTTLYDFGERNGFTTFGPPLIEDAPRYREETQLYLDMVQNFYVIAEDEDDFAYVAEAFSVPVATFRPLSFRPDGKKAEVDDIFADDPLPESFSSTSYYVDSIRPSFVPGGPFQPRSLDEVKLGDDSRMKSLFLDPPKKVEKPPETKDAKKSDDPKKADAKDAASDEEETADDSSSSSGSSSGSKPGSGKPSSGGKNVAGKDDAPAGRINAPKKPPGVAPGSDEETLQALRQAVHELGLQKQLNFEPNQYSQATAQMGEGKPPLAPATAIQQEPAAKIAVKPSVNEQILNAEKAAKALAAGEKLPEEKALDVKAPEVKPPVSNDPEALKAQQLAKEIEEDEKNNPAPSVKEAPTPAAKETVKETAAPTPTVKPAVKPTVKPAAKTPAKAAAKTAPKKKPVKKKTVKKADPVPSEPIPKPIEPPYQAPAAPADDGVNTKSDFSTKKSL